VRRIVTRLTVVVVLLLLAAAPVAQAQVGKLPRIGMVLPGSPGPEYDRRLDAFRQGLRDLGYVENEHVLIDYRWARERYDHVPELVAELLRRKVDVLVVDSARVAYAAKSATSAIPIVLAVVGDAVGTGLVKSLARPGGNITGMTLMTPELGEKRLALLKELAPRVTRVAALMNPDNPTSQVYWREVQAAAPKMAVNVRALEVRRPADLERAFAAAVTWRADALFVIEDPVLVPALQGEIVAFATRQRWPTISGLRSLVDAGGLVSFGASFPELFRSAAAFVVKILKGARPSDLPVEQPSKFELVVSLKAARGLGLTVPPSLQLRADQVVE
jgi:putative ABC transport system substrate-binding protein